MTPPGTRLDRGPGGASALMSADGLYRYRLRRVLTAPHIDHDPRVVVCGLNPSTADAFRDDPTIRREAGFARAWGGGVLVKVNAYAWRATRPAAGAGSR